MTDINEVRRFTDAVISMIKEDQGSGQIPLDVSSLDELDNRVDVDDYYRRIRLSTGDHGAAELHIAPWVKRIGRRLASAQGGPWHVIWRRPDGAQDIGKTVGYATQADAQTVGRAYLHAHGGGFHLCRAPHCVRALMPGQVRRSATGGTYASSPPHPGGTSLGYRSSTRAA